MLTGRSRKRRPAAAVLAALLAALALAACGGDDSGSDTSAADEAALKQLMLDYAASDDPSGCDLFSEAGLAQIGGREECARRYRETGGAITITVDEIKVDGDKAQVRITDIYNGQHKQYTFPATRVGTATDSYDGWRLDADERALDAQSGTTTTTSATTTAEPSSTPVTTSSKEDVIQRPDQWAVVYDQCLHERGAKDVKQDTGAVPPSVSFSGGGSRVNALFGTSEQDAQQGLQVAQARHPFFAHRFGIVVLYSVGDPLADDLDAAIGCAKEVG